MRSAGGWALYAIWEIAATIATLALIGWLLR
jgi:hypothetical protein